MPVDYELRDHVAWITMNEPETLNSWMPTIRDGMQEAFERFRDDPEAWVAILHGNGRAFSSGGNTRAMGSTPEEPPVGLRQPYWNQSLMDGIEVGMNVYKPVIAAIHGYALGMGLSVALACDFRIAAEGTEFGFPEARLGFPPAIGTVHAVRVLGIANALELVLVADRIDTERALRMNLVREVVPADELLSAAAALAERLCASSPIGLRSSKELVLRSVDMAFTDAVRLGGSLQHLAREASPEDRREGLRAIAERRAPKFTGR